MSSEPPREHEIDRTYGLIHVPVFQEAARTRVRRAVQATYEACGLRIVAWEDPDEAIKELEPISGITCNDNPELGPDEVFVVAEDEPWVAVMSRRWEWTPIGLNPLARDLSSKFELLVVTCVENKYVEYALWEGGRLQALTAIGPDVPDDLPEVPELDLDWFADKGALVDNDELRSYQHAPGRFLNLAGPGCDRAGHVDGFEAAPLADYQPSEYLIFRA